MLESYSPCWPHDLFIMGLFSFFSVNAINIDYVYVYVRLEDMIKDRIGTKLNQLYKIDTIFFFNWQNMKRIFYLLPTLWISSNSLKKGQPVFRLHVNNMQTTREDGQNAK